MPAAHRRTGRLPAAARALLAAAVCGVLATSAACGSSAAEAGRATAPPASAEPTSPTPSPATPAVAAVPAEEAVLGFAVVGDSITAGTASPQDPSVPGAGSWVPAAQGGPLEFRGGWAVPGATTADMLAGVRPADADVVVVLAGTNDVTQGIPWETRADNIQDIVDAVGVDDVLVSAIPPLDRRPAEALAHNGRLAALARERGWGFTDPWTDVRTPEGRFTSGASLDGTHPTSGVADAVGRRLRDALLSGAGA
jgi:lysophospholipase L1-like esterase